MVFTLDTSLHEQLAPLAWLVGRWQGAGLVGYPTIESQQFGQEIVCSHDGRPFLRWESRTWLLDDDGNQVRPLATELGFWRPVPTHTDGTNVELLLTHPTGFVEMYAGIAEPAKVELRTDGVMRSPDGQGVHRRPPDVRLRQQRPALGDGHGRDGPADPVARVGGAQARRVTARGRPGAALRA